MSNSGQYSIVEFVVPGAAKGKQRPRFARVGRFVRAYTPEETARRENMVALCCRQAAPGIVPVDGPITLKIVAQYAMPRSWSGKKRQQMEWAYKTSKPDADNVLKLVADGLNGIAWFDDAQVANSVIEKRWSDKNQLDVTIVRMGYGRVN